MTLPVTRPRKIILPCGRHSILLSRRCSFYFDLNGPSLPRYIWPALRVSRWYKEKKDEFQSHPLSLKANPYQRRKWNRTAWLPSFFSFFLLDNQAALPSNKWLRVSKQPLPLGRRFAAPLLSGPAAVRHLNSKLRSDPILFDGLPAEIVYRSHNNSFLCVARGAMSSERS